MKRLAKICLLLALGWAGCAGAKDCIGLRELQNQKPRVASMAKEASSVLERNVAQAPACSALQGVLTQVANNEKRGGRRLEEEKPLDPAEAQADLRTALDDPALKSRLAALQREIKDDTTRLFFEAAVFDEEGHYGARDLRIQELQQRLQ